MANWEYKVISSGKGGFASPSLMEKFINDLGQEQWEIINFHTAPDNPLAFTGLARRPTQRDWTLEDAAAAAARAETDKLRAEFEAKFKAGASGAAAAGEERAESYAEQQASADDGFRRPVDTSRDNDPDAPETSEDEWQKLAAEDELPTFFDALKPHMRRNQRGPGMSVGIDFLAKKWKLDEADIKGALVECGLQIPADENAKPVFVEYDGDLYWVNINRRGEVWVNTREKPEPVFRIVQGTRLSDEETAVIEQSSGAQGGGGGSHRDRDRDRDRKSERERRQEPPAQTQPQSPAGEGAQGETAAVSTTQTGAESAPAPAATQQPAAQPRQGGGEPKSFLAKVRSMMRRNRRGRGGSGSFQYLIKALKLDEAQLLEKFAEFGLRLDESGKHVIATENGFDYWLNKNQRGEIWINAEESRGGPKAAAAAPASTAVEGATVANGDTGAATEAAVASVEATSTPEIHATDVAAAEPVEAAAQIASADANAKSVSVSTEAPAAASSRGSAESRTSSAHGNTLAAVRLLMEPKKRGEGVTAQIAVLAEKLEKSEEAVLTALSAAGLQLPEDPKGKPTFAEQGGEIFWLNVNAKGQIWLNAKAAKKTRSKKSE